MKNILGLIFLAVLSLSLYNCSGREASQNLSARGFDSVFNNIIVSNLPKARLLVDSLEQSSADSMSQSLAETYRAICNLAEYKLESVHLMCDRVEKFISRQSIGKAERYRIAMRNICTAKGIAYSYSRDVDLATKYLKAAIGFEETKRLPQAYLNLADNYNQNGQYVNAAECYRRALQINDSLGKIVRPDLIYNGLAMSYINISAFEEAEKNLDKAKESLSQMSSYDKYILYNNYGNLYYYTGEYDKAHNSFKHAFKFIKKSGSGTLESVVPLFNLAEINILLHEPDSAEVCIDTLEKSLRGKDIPVFSQHLKTLEMALAIEQNNLPLATNIMESFTENVLPPELHRIRSRYMQQYYEKSGLYKEAYALAKNNYSIRDSIDRTQYRVKIADIYIRYKQDTTLISKQNLLVVKDEQLRRSRTFWFSVATILVVLLIAIYLFSRHQREKMMARYIHKIFKLRMENIRNCLSPHFTFNVLNREISSYEEDDPRRKNLYSLAKILRRCVELSSQMTVTLSEELDFVDAYVQLECSRWGDRFEYIKRISDDIDLEREIIPSMFLQIPVENAIKHGLRGIEKKRRLAIEISKNDKGILLVVKNNGIKYMSQMVTSGTGTGLKVIYQTIAFLNSRNVNKIELFISTNKSEEGVEEGAKVEILIPNNYNYQAIQTE